MIYCRLNGVGRNALMHRKNRIGSEIIFFSKRIIIFCWIQLQLLTRCIDWTLMKWPWLAGGRKNCKSISRRFYFFDKWALWLHRLFIPLLIIVKGTIIQEGGENALYAAAAKKPILATHILFFRCKDSLAKHLIISGPSEEESVLRGRFSPSRVSQLLWANLTSCCCCCCCCYRPNFLHDEGKSFSASKNHWSRMPLRGRYRCSRTIHRRRGPCLNI